MVISIHQPEHFPYMGYFQKMAKADMFVILDNVNYRKNYYQNRNRFLNTNGVEEWFTIPVEKEATKKWIKDVGVNNNSNWRKKLLTKLNQNFKLDLEYIYDSSNLLEINTKSIEWGRDRLGITVPMVTSSELNVTGSKSELLANICNKLNATKYISGPSGRDYLDLNFFNGIEVEFFSPKVDNYFSSLYNLS
jgi:hypothetical protein